MFYAKLEYLQNIDFVCLLRLKHLCKTGINHIFIVAVLSSIYVSFQRLKLKEKASIASFNLPKLGRDAAIFCILSFGTIFLSFDDRQAVRVCSVLSSIVFFIPKYKSHLN